MLLRNLVYSDSFLRQLSSFLKKCCLLYLLLHSSFISQIVLAEKKFIVVTTFTIIQDIAQNVAGNVAVVESITKPGAEIHDYQPTPHDIIKAKNADLILWNGMDLERWLERFFKNTKKIPTVFLSKGIKPLPIRAGSCKGKPNPHAWMSPRDVQIYIENIRKALVKYNPSNATIYNRNAKTYSDKISALDAPLRKRLSRIPYAQRWLVSSEGAFSYLARDYQLKECYLWPSNADGQVSPKQVQRVVDTIRKYHIPVIFSESTISDKPARAVAKGSGAQYGGPLYVDSLSTKDGLVPTYIDLLKVTVNTIAKGFSQ